MTTKLPPPYRERGGLVLPEELHLPVDGLFVVTPNPDAPDDQEPLPDGMQQLNHVRETIEVVRAFFWGRPGVLVNGDAPVYYLDEDGRQQIVRPDCYVAFGVDPIAIGERNGYYIEKVGKPPEFVLEVASISTFQNDIGPKRDLYARLGIEEYWRFDATTNYYPAPLAGDQLIDGEYRPIEINRDAQGVSRGRSPTLGLVLCWDQGYLRFYDPTTGRYRNNLPESESENEAERAAREDAEARATVDAAAREDAEAALAAERSARAADRQDAEAALAAERMARAVDREDAEAALAAERTFLAAERMARAVDREDAEAALAAERARTQELEEELRRRQSEG